MDKIDRLGWVAGFSFKAYGLKIGVRTNKPEALDRMRELLPPGWKPCDSQVVDRLYSLLVGGPDPRRNIHRFHILYVNFARQARSKDLEQVLDAFEANLHIHVAERARGRVFLHAGVVGWRGKAILIPGRSFSGKTTLVSELVRAGATYYSDEYAVLDEQGRVYPFPRPLAIREDGGTQQTRYSIESLGGRAGVRPLPVGLVVLSRYKQGGRWRPQQLSDGQGALELLNNAVPARSKPADVLGAVRQVVSKAQVLKGVRGEAAEMVAHLLSY
ncbi:MAG TPA: hypothetical protein VNO70_17500 [Blastocatellia bacterium]|nr:hypothetical protein [Blastocatellia bacterium]